MREAGQFSVGEVISTLDWSDDEPLSAQVICTAVQVSVWSGHPTCPCVWHMRRNWLDLVT